MANKRCTHCGAKPTDASERTSISDRGLCHDCHRRWQSGEICKLCDKSAADEPHDADCPAAEE